MPTIKDVALACGVSTATVSQVLNNGRRPVHALTRERVLRAAQHLDYRPNAVARGLVQKRMNTLGVVFAHGTSPTEVNPFFAGVLNGILSMSTERRQNVTLCTLPSWEDAMLHLSDICDGRCDGVMLLVPPAGCPLVEALQRRDIPLVLISGHGPDEQTASVDIDNVRASFQMTEHLLRRGHRRIGFVDAPKPWTDIFVQERRDGYRQAMREWGVYDPMLSELHVDERLDVDLPASHWPTALFCSHDLLALSMLEKLQQQGRRVPEDISIVGFDDIPGAAASHPALTTVRQPMAQIGLRATEVLLALVNNTAPSIRRELLGTELVLRHSDAALHP